MNNQRRERGSTFLDHTHPDLDLGGRYRNLEPHSTVGKTPIPQYGHAAPWSETQLPDEPPLGIDINWQEPTGAEAEIQASIDALSDDRSSASSPPIVAGEHEAHFPTSCSPLSSTGSPPVGGVGKETLARYCR
jgi:hypothetical protein